MYTILIVDDETIIRTSIRMLVDWEKEGFYIVGDAKNGKEALKYVKENHVDIVITDIKMPVMDGIELIIAISQLEVSPQVVVLSGYNDFPLVRQTFKLGVNDYILKSDINTDSLLECIKNVSKKFIEREDTALLEEKHSKQNTYKNTYKSEALRQLLLGTQDVQTNDLLACEYILCCFEIDDFTNEVMRFGAELSVALVQPIINFASQVPRIASRGTFCSISPSRYVLLYPIRNHKNALEEHEDILKDHKTIVEAYEIVSSVCIQVMNVWKNYMNIAVSVGMSSIYQGEEEFSKGFEEAFLNLSMKFIFGRGRIHTPKNYKIFEPQKAIEARKRYKGLIESIQNAFGTEIVEEQQKVFTYLYTLTQEEVVLESLYIIYNIALVLRENNDEIWSVFNTDIDFYKKLTRLESIKQMEMWLINFMRWIADYIEHHYARKQEDLIERAKGFIYDNFSDPSMCLSAVASYIGFNEKYFSTWFTKGMNISFSTYVTDLRIKKAKELMEQTDMKIYEISESVGYKSVEHFNRVFKKIVGLSPKAYKKS